MGAGAIWCDNIKKSVNKKDAKKQKNAKRKKDVKTNIALKRWK